MWSHVNGTTYRFKFKAYLYNAAAVAIGYQIVTHDLELENDALNYTSEGTSESFDMTGVKTASGCSSAVGSRMVLN